MNYIRPWKIFIIFLIHGLKSFGGPVAHIGYFRNDFVVRRKWLSNEEFHDIVALCQFLPGPMSSQVGFTIGILKGRLLGGFLAWLGFTAPSAILMIGFGISTYIIEDGIPLSIVHGLKLAAVPIVALALYQMGIMSCGSIIKTTLALITCFLMLITNSIPVQIGLIILAALVGKFFITADSRTNETLIYNPVSKALSITSISIFVSLLISLPILVTFTTLKEIELFSSFYRVGYLVFGGGHVVLPLFQNEVVTTGWVDQNTFLAGYGAAQAIPGPMFAFAGYLGTVSEMGFNYLKPWAVGLIAIIAVFLPSFLILTAALPYWQILRVKPSLKSSISGVNAAVVGLLLAVFIDPVITRSLLSFEDCIIALCGLVLLAFKKAPVWLVVVLTIALGALFHTYNTNVILSLIGLQF
ncbi:MAG: putative chromate transport protein [Alphaproteobacteria bacterium MarineAlpha12_Bin1]|jgi:chromate transporter|nr:MAG: putative chromate transport protein [Alphaproteobacteria bacterium MarineAlpha12_Bin1]|tara:strand:+ start:6927 stop:8162 length:1236 start_codon:yes stop_codon:yes gene_type:complete